MGRALALFCAALALLWGSLAAAAIGTPNNLGTLPLTTVSTTVYLPITSVTDTPSGSVVIVGWASNSSATYTVSDSGTSGGNTYASPLTGTFNTSDHLLNTYSNTTVDLPPPCTVTATQTSTQLLVTAVVSCSGTDVLTIGQQISGGSFTGVISGTCTLIAGAATCTITGGATVATPGTATISSAIKFSYTGSLSTVGAAFSVSGLATSSPRDISGTINTTGSPSTSGSPISPGSATGTLTQANEIVVGEIGIGGTYTGSIASNSPFTNLSVPAASSPSFGWGYDVVASTASVTYAPTWTTQRAYGANVWTFEGAGAAPAFVPTADPLLGVP